MKASSLDVARLMTGKVRALFQPYLSLTRLLVIAVWTIPAVSLDLGSCKLESLKISTIDRDLVELVALDFERHEDCDYGSGKSNVAVNRLVVNTDNLQSDEWVRYYAKSAWGGIKPLLELLRLRNQLDRRVDWRFTDSPKLKQKDLYRMDERSLSRLRSQVRCFVSFLLPAVSSDGQNALVAFHPGPSPHGAIGFYVLRIRQGNWSIESRTVLHLL